MWWFVGPIVSSLKIILVDMYLYFWLFEKLNGYIYQGRWFRVSFPFFYIFLFSPFFTFYSPSSEYINRLRLGKVVSPLLSSPSVTSNFLNSLSLSCSFLDVSLLGIDAHWPCFGRIRCYLINKYIYAFIFNNGESLCDHYIVMYLNYYYYWVTPAGTTQRYYIVGWSGEEER